MAATITTTIQASTVTEVGSVVVTEITQDADDNYVREIRVMGVPDGSGDVPKIFTLRLVGTTEVNVQLTAPTQTF